jgi:regulator of sigma E protease
MFFDSIYSFVILLGVLIFVHEFGHFIVAKSFGVKVLRFSLGFGPVLLRKQIGETEYVLSVVPLGGYVKMQGDEGSSALEGEPDGDTSGAGADEEGPDDEQVAAKDESDEAEEEIDETRSFSNRPVMQRIAIVAAGPVMNLVTGFVLFSFLSLFGDQIRLPAVGEVTKGMPAEAAGFQPGDLIVSVDDFDVETWEEMQHLIMISDGSEIVIELLRSGELETVTVSPVKYPDDDRMVVGIVWSGEIKTRSTLWYMAPVEGMRRTWRVTVQTVDVIGRMLSGKGSKDEIGGPIAIAAIAGQAMAMGILSFIHLTALISINLAVLNLLPIPVLDGGHLVFFLVEAVRGRPVGLRVREAAQQIGLMLLMALVIFIIYNDIMQVFFKAG